MPDQSDELTSSPVLRYLTSRLREVLPDNEKPKLDAFDEAIRSTTAHGDLHRAVHCAHWAVELSGHRSHLPISTKLGEIVRVTRDIEFGISFGFMVGDVGRAEDLLSGHRKEMDHTSSVSEDVKVQMVDDALAVAQHLGQTEGWDAVPWEQLMKDVTGAKPQ